MTNDEIRRNDQIRMTKSRIAQLSTFRHSTFGFLSSFNDLSKSGLSCQQTASKSGAVHEPQSAAGGPKRADTAACSWFPGCRHGCFNLAHSLQARAGPVAGAWNARRIPAG